MKKICIFLLICHLSFSCEILPELNPSTSMGSEMEVFEINDTFYLDSDDRIEENYLFQINGIAFNSDITYATHRDGSKTLDLTFYKQETLKSAMNIQTVVFLKENQLIGGVIPLSQWQYNYYGYYYASEALLFSNPNDAPNIGPPTGKSYVAIRKAAGNVHYNGWLEIIHHGNKDGIDDYTIIKRMAYSKKASKSIRAGQL